MKKVLILLVAFTVLIPVTMASNQIVSENEAVEHSCGLASTNKKSVSPHSDNIIRPTATLGVPFYAYVTADLSEELEEGPCSFNPNSPENIIPLAPTISEQFISAGTWVKGVWYGCEYGGLDDTNIWTIDQNTGEMSIVGDYDPGDTGLSLNGLAFDPISEHLYACTSTALYTVNMDTAALTLVGNFVTSLNMMIAIDFDHEGNLYGIDIVTDGLYEINKNTAAESLIGYTGYSHNYAQDMAYDHDEHIMYLSAYTDMGGGLYTVNLNTGVATHLGNFQNDAEITGFAIRSGAQIEIGDISGGLGASVVLRNTGTQPATNVTWSVSFSNAVVLLPLGGTASKTIESIPAGEDQIIKARFLGFGGILKFTDIIVTVESDTGGIVEEVLPAKLLLFFVII